MKRKFCYFPYFDILRDSFESYLSIFHKMGISIIPSRPSINDAHLLYLKIHESDFILLVNDSRIFYSDTVSSIAEALNKPIIRLDLVRKNVQIIKEYEDNNRHNTISIAELEAALKVVTNNVFSEFNPKCSSFFHNNDKLIGIEIVDLESDYETELSITFYLTKYIKEMSESEHINLIHISKGSLKSVFSIDFKSWTILIEKFMFFLPELEKKKLENKRIKSEIKQVDAQTELLIAEKDQLQIQNKIKQANAFLDLIERGEKIGLNIQLDQEILIRNSFDLLEITEPSKMKE